MSVERVFARQLGQVRLQQEMALAGEPVLWPVPVHGYYPLAANLNSMTQHPEMTTVRLDPFFERIAMNSSSNPKNSMTTLYPCLVLPRWQHLLAHWM